jgi:hypothetical protein
VSGAALFFSAEKDGNEKWQNSYKRGEYPAKLDLIRTKAFKQIMLSKWNKIEHRLFPRIGMNWRGRPLVNHETIVKLIG